MYTPQEISSLFPEFEADLSRFLSEVSETRIFKEGEMLMKTGQYFKSAVIIVSGRVKLYREGDGGNEYFMYFLESGSACALSMLCASRNQASEVMAVSVEETEAILIPIQHMDRLMSTYRSWYHYVLGTYRARFEELLSVIDDIAFKNMDERLDSYLKRQSDSLGKTLRLTHQQIANDLNSSREVVSRLLKNMERSGRLELHRSHIEWKG